MDGSAKRQQAAEEARAALEAAVQEASVEPAVDEPAGDTPLVDKLPANDDIPALPDANPELDRLQSEVSRLTARLDDENSPTYKSRWDALKGQFNARGNEIESLTNKLTALEQQLTEKVKNPEPVQMDDDPEYAVLSEELGPAAAKIIYRQNQELKELQGKISGVDEELKATKGKTEKIEGETGQIKSHQANTEAERYAARISALVPDWSELMGTQEDDYATQNPKFTEYLKKSVRGKTNFQSLSEAYGAGDISTVKEIFDEGREFSGVTQKAPVPKPSSKADKFIEPGKTGQGTTEPTGQGAMIPESEIKALSTSIRMQTFKGTKVELEALKEKYRQAKIEGRVIEGR